MKAAQTTARDQDLACSTDEDMAVRVEAIKSGIKGLLDEARAIIASDEFRQPCDPEILGEIAEQHPEEFGQLNADFFRRCQAIGYHLSKGHSGMLMEMVGIEGWKPPNPRTRINRDERIAKHAEALAKALREDDETSPLGQRRDVQQFCQTLDYIADVRRGLVEEGKRWPVRRGPRKNVALSSLISSLVMLSSTAGVPPTFKWDGDTTAGPFAEFLKLVWEILPDNVRSENAEAFARYAKEELEQTRRRDKDGLTRRL